jgi:hypothetical protein
MNIIKFKEILETLNAAGFKETVIDRCGDGKVRVRGITDSESLAIFAEYDFDLEKSIAVTAIPSVLNRLNLFDLEKAKVELSDKGRRDQVMDYTTTMLITQGRREVFHTFPSPRNIRAPSEVMKDEIVDVVTLDSEKTDRILKAITALQSVAGQKERVVTFRGQGDNILVSISDDEGNYFHDVVSKNTSGEWENHWNSQAFVKMIRNMVKSGDDISLKIGAREIMYLSFNNLEFMVLPEEIF